MNFLILDVLCGKRRPSGPLYGSYAHRWVGIQSVVEPRQTTTGGQNFGLGLVGKHAQIRKHGGYERTRLVRISKKGLEINFWVCKSRN